MRKIRIGVWSEEKEYVSRLAAFLQRFGKGLWEVFAFTQPQAVQIHLHKESLDMLIGTDKEGLKEYENQKKLIKIWLTECKEESKCLEEAWFELYRYQGAENIGAYIYKILREKHSNTDISKKLVVMYSPIGRCGKTTFALDFIKEASYGRWLYIGLEDYSSFGSENLEQKQEGDMFLYHWKEHNAQQVQKTLVESKQIIITGNSFFDARQLMISDFEWLRDIVQGMVFRGILFDMGSGVLQDFHMLKVFDDILVPYLEEEKALNKKEQFEKQFSYHDMEEEKKHLHYINMAARTEWKIEMQKIFGGDDG